MEFHRMDLLCGPITPGYEVKVDKKKKKVSHTEQLRKLRKDRDDWREWCHENSHKLHKAEMKIIELERMLPVKFYKITFKMLAIDDKTTVEYTEIIESYSVPLAIEKLKRDKKHPKTFKMVDLKVLN